MDAQTHWKVEKAAKAAGFDKELDDVSVPLSPFVDARSEQKHNDYVDHSFLDHVPTELELLDVCEHVYIRPATGSEENLADMLKKGKREEMFEILDHNGQRLYFVCTKSGLPINERRSIENDRFDFTWYDFHGHETVGTSGKIDKCVNCLNEVRIVQPSDYLQPESDISMGKIHPRGCCCIFSCRPKYKLKTHDGHSFSFITAISNCVCCPNADTFTDFKIIDGEDRDCLGNIFKLQAQVDFSHQRERSRGYHTPNYTNFDGFAVFFTTAELGVEAKAMIISMGFLLNEYHFHLSTDWCGVGYSCASFCCACLLITSIFGFGFLGLLSFF